MTAYYDVTQLNEDTAQKKWKNFPFKHGIHLLVFSYNGLSTYDGSTTVYNRNGNMPIEIERDYKKMFIGMSYGNVMVQGDVVSIIGRFEKRGGQLFFTPLQEKFNA